MALVTAMSSRGQIVLPKRIRTALKLDEGTQFAVFADNDNILLKPIKEPNVADFIGLMQQAQEWAKSQGLAENDITNAIKAVRKKS